MNFLVLEYDFFSILSTAVFNTDRGEKNGVMKAFQ